MSKSDELLEPLRQAPEKFEFFEALRRWEAAHPEQPRLGRSARVSQDPVRLGQAPSTSFAPVMLKEITPGKDGVPERIVGYFLGLFGPNGALPIHLTEYAHDRSYNHKDKTFVGFADIFHHRILSLFYRAWADAQPTVQADRPESDRFAAYIGALFGLGQPSVLGADALPDDAKRFFAGRLGSHARNPEGLAAWVSALFGVKAEVQEFRPSWMRLGQDRLLLGLANSSSQLGLNAVVGAAVWGAQHQFRLILGPLKIRDFEEFLPGSLNLAKLVAAVRLYVGGEMYWDLQIIVSKGEVPKCSLASYGQLGWTSWLMCSDRVSDAGDALFTT